MSKELDYLDDLLENTPLTLNKRTIIECIKEKIQRLEAIDNAEPSEALECLEEIRDFRYGKDKLLVCQTQMYKTIKQALLKAQFLEEEYNNLMEDKDNLESELFKQQEPKHYLKWEDLEFDFDVPTTIKVKMGNTQYLLSLRISLSDVKSVVLRDNNLKPYLHLFEKKKQFFNDLHLERVEE